MEIIMRGVNDITPYEHNPRKNDDAVDAVAASIKEFGFKVPIVVDKDGIIVAGHTRLKAAKKLGMEQVPCIVADDLTDEQIKAFRLVDNKVAELADWDFSELETELADIDMDMAQFGFDDFDIDANTDIVEDEAPEPPEEPKTKRGQIYQLGRHRLMCGDATSADDFRRLMCGNVADIVITSPPYNTGHMDVALSDERGGGFNKATQKKYINDDDKRTDEEYCEFLNTNIGLLLENAEEVFYNIGVVSGSKNAIANILWVFAEQFKDLLYWEKENPMPIIQENCIASAVELIIALGNNGTRSFNSFNDRMFHGVIKGQSASSNKYADIHKATFPVYLPSEIIERFTKKDGSVIDCFCGTGTTLIACEQLGRRCYGIEIEPKYVDVIIERWENLTGQKAVLIDG